VRASDLAQDERGNVNAAISSAARCWRKFFVGKKCNKPRKPLIFKQ
jgi:hypothetical protein